MTKRIHCQTRLVDDYLLSSVSRLFLVYLVKQLGVLRNCRLLYGVIEGCANGCLVDAAKLLLRVMKEEKGSGSRLLYNSCLRFTDRRYSVASLAQTIDLRTPLGELVTCRALFDKNNAAALPVLSGLSKLQMATLFTRAADLKCQDLFPTAEELQSIGEFVSKQK